jgi:NRPS condensation-like uncharacterized protein
MGTWGIGIFDSDDSADFLVELTHIDQSSEDIQFIHNTLKTVIKKGHYINIREAYRALVATFIVKAIITGNFMGLPSTFVEWVKSKNSKEYAILIEKSRQAIHNIRTNSELRELWKSTSDFDSWLETLDDLQQNWSEKY